MIYLLYKTDVWHTRDSRELIGVCTSKLKVVKLCKQQAKKDEVKISDDDIYNLGHISQTQGYEGGGEFLFEEVDKNILL